jgi:hypothetical protein
MAAEVNEETAVGLTVSPPSKMLDKGAGMYSLPVLLVLLSQLGSKKR